MRYLIETASELAIFADRIFDANHRTPGYRFDRFDFFEQRTVQFFHFSLTFTTDCALRDFMLKGQVSFFRFAGLVFDIGEELAAAVEFLPEDLALFFAVAQALAQILKEADDLQLLYGLGRRVRAAVCLFAVAVGDGGGDPVAETCHFTLFLRFILWPVFIHRLAAFRFRSEDLLIRRAVLACEDILTGALSTHRVGYGGCLIDSLPRRLISGAFHHPLLQAEVIIRIIGHDPSLRYFV